MCNIILLKTHDDLDRNEIDVIEEHPVTDTNDIQFTILIHLPDQLIVLDLRLVLFVLILDV